jgi:hypothetical protein
MTRVRRHGDAAGSFSFGWSGRHPVFRFAIPEDTVDQLTENSNQVSGCFVRLLWMAVGNLILVLAAVGIAQNKAGFRLTVMDAIFIVTALCLPLVRYVDIRYLNGKTSNSQPATMTDWFRYTVTVLGVSVVLWLGAHVVS